MQIGDLFNLEEMRKELEEQQELANDKKEFEKHLKGN